MLMNDMVEFQPCRLRARVETVVSGEGHDVAHVQAEIEPASITHRFVQGEDQPHGRAEKFGTGATLLVLRQSVTPLLMVKVFLGGAAVLVNLFCITVVVRRGRGLERSTDEASLWRASRTVLACFAVGLLCAAGAAVLGFRFALDRLG